MNILHINCNYLSTTLHQLMVESLERQEIENTVFVPTYDEKCTVIKKNENVLVSQCFKKTDRFIFKNKQRKIFKAIDNLINVKKFDCIHAYTLFTDGNCARQLSKKYNIPYVVAIRNTDINVFFKYAIHLRHRGFEILKDAAAVFFLSSSYEKQVLNFIPEHLRETVKRKSYIVPNGIDKYWFDNLFKKTSPEEFGKVHAVYAGGIDKNKNILHTVDALKLLQSEGYGVMFDVIGKTIDEEVLNKLQKEKFVQYHPPVTKEKLLDFYRQADLFIMPSHTETFGLVYAEAMSQGLPVLYTKNQGFDGQFADGEVGFAVSDTDPKELAEKIKQVLNNYSFISNNATNKVEKFDWTQIATVYKEVYRNVLNN